LFVRKYREERKKGRMRRKGGRREGREG